MQKLLMLLIVGCSLTFSACGEESRQQEQEITEAYLKSIAQSRAYIDYRVNHEAYIEASRRYDREAFIAFFEANEGAEKEPLDSLLGAMQHIEGINTYVPAFNRMSEAMQELKRAYPNFFELSMDHQRVILETYQANVGFDPSSVLENIPPQ